ncbi:hypothetical protein P7C70_g6608, partial [Phenoliferia sp. Uapishka_3]
MTSPTPALPPPVQAVTGLAFLDVQVEISAIDQPPQAQQQPIPTAIKVFIIKRVWQPIAHPRVPTLPTLRLRPSAPPHLSHSALVLFQVLTGEASAAPTPSLINRRLSKRGPPTRARPASPPPTHPLHPTVSLLSLPELTKVHGKRLESKQPKKVSKKAIKKLKSDLLRQKNAVRIVKDIRKIRPPAGSTCACYSLRVIPSDEDSSTSRPTSPDGPTFTMVSIPTSGGGLAGLAGVKAGAFDLAADATGALLTKFDQGTGIVAPLDRMGVYIFWWGYELCLPPPVLETLGHVHSVSNTLFKFLQAFVISGGAPELAPFVKYLSSYIDLEWSAITSQNKGHGVILAATWLLPVALVPRPWDFDLPNHSNSSILIPAPDIPESPGSGDETPGSPGSSNDSPSSPDTSPGSPTTFEDLKENLEGAFGEDGVVAII